MGRFVTVSNKDDLRAQIKMYGDQINGFDKEIERIKTGVPTKQDIVIWDYNPNENYEVYLEEKREGLRAYLGYLRDDDQLIKALNEDKAHFLKIVKRKEELIEWIEKGRSDE